MSMFTFTLFEKFAKILLTLCLKSSKFESQLGIMKCQGHSDEKNLALSVLTSFTVYDRLQLLSS